MPVTASVSVSKKIGLADYGSLGASCSVQFEVDPNSLQKEPAAFQQAMHNVYLVVSQAVEDELARHHDPADAPSGAVAPASRTTSMAPPAPQRNGNGHLATSKQLDYARQLAQQIDGLGVRKLDSLAQKMFGKPIAGLTSLDASGLIDMLKAIKAGEINLDAALNGVAS